MTVIRRALASIAPWLGVAVLTLGVGEAVARFGLGIEPLTLESLVWRHDPRWGWYHQPSSQDTFVKLGFRQQVRINSRGLREREIPFEKPAGTFRVLVIGDSAVVSFEVPPEAVFTRVAEDELRRRGYAVEMINAGVRGFGTDQSLLFLRDEGLRYQPDLVLYKWTDNDREDNATIHRPFRKFSKPWFDLDGSGSLVLRGVPVPVHPYRSNLRVGEDGSVRNLPIPWRSQATLWLRDNAVCRSAFATALLKLALAAPQLAGPVAGMGSYDDRQDVGADLDRGSRLFRVTAAMIGEMRRISEAAGASFRMIDASGPWPRALREAVGLPDLGDPELYWARVPEGVSLHVPYDPHWNEEGHRIYAGALADALLHSGLLDRARSAPSAAPGTPEEGRGAASEQRPAAAGPPRDVG